MPSSRDSNACPFSRNVGGPLPLSPLCSRWCSANSRVTQLYGKYLLHVVRLRIPQLHGSSFDAIGATVPNKMWVSLPQLMRALRPIFMGLGYPRDTHLRGMYLLHLVRASAF